MDESDDFRRGYDAAMLRCQELVRGAERDREVALVVAARAHGLAEAAADLLRPMAEILQRELETSLVCEVKLEEE